MQTTKLLILLLFSLPWLKKHILCASESQLNGLNKKEECFCTIVRTNLVVGEHTIRRQRINGVLPARQLMSVTAV